MKVLHVSKFYPPVFGGIETVAWELVEGLNQSGVHTDVLCSHQQLRGVAERWPGGYRVRRAGSLGMVLSTSMAASMPWYLAQMSRQADIVHLHMPDPTAAAAFWMARPRAKLVVQWHSDVIRQRLALKLYGPLQHWLLARADAVVATSPPYAQTSQALQAWRHKVHVVPIGISDNRGAAQRQTADRLRQRMGGRRLVFALGRMTYYKGFEVLIDAAAALPDNCAVMIGGDGEWLGRIKALVARRGLADKVHLLGHIADDALASHFEACDVFCMPSTVRAEAYGVAMLEAMLMCKPVVASDIAGTGVPWVNQHGVSGLNVPAGDPVALAGALNQLLADEGLRAELGRGARLRYEQDFSATRMTERTLALYRQLLPHDNA